MPTYKPGPASPYKTHRNDTKAIIISDPSKDGSPKLYSEPEVIMKTRSPSFVALGCVNPVAGVDYL